uniref:ribosomal protein S3 n=1 Tax=Merotricha bacillata TaxID=658122 RepID=UPI0021148AAE|nr:ribosomal protein S3 [Merotricha bacillata]UTE94495.1 ribosomal protein S3 [Merotricha bacillata]
MGHKTHPIGFRLGIITNHNASWFSSFKNYSLLVQEDNKIRSELLNFLKLKNIENAGIAKLLINRNSRGDQIQLEIHTAFPAIIVGKSGKTLEEINKLFEKLLNKKKKLIINLIEITEPYKEASIVADFIVEQLEKRVQFKRAVKKALSLAYSENKVEGIKIQVSGRLNGAEIARTEWLRKGRVPLQTLRANIDYSNKIAKTIYGILGVKIWLFKGEIFK